MIFAGTLLMNLQIAAADLHPYKHSPCSIPFVYAEAVREGCWRVCGDGSRRLEPSNPCRHWLRGLLCGDFGDVRGIAVLMARIAEAGAEGGNVPPCPVPVRSLGAIIHWQTGTVSRVKIKRKGSAGEQGG